MVDVYFISGYIFDMKYIESERRFLQYTLVVGGNFAIFILPALFVYYHYVP